MRKRLSNAIWGLLFIIMGIGIAGNIIFGWHFSIFFPGWWTLFIIVPSVLNIVEKGWNTGNAISLGIGVFLLLGQQHIFPVQLFGRLFLPIILMIIGASMVLNGSFHVKNPMPINIKSGPTDYVGIFSGRKVKYSMEKFYGCSADAVFGGVDIDLRDAIFEEDVVIEAAAIFGGIDILVPPNVRVKVSSVPIFGSVSNKTKEPTDINAPTIFLNATCMFGGVDVK